MPLNTCRSRTATARRRRRTEAGAKSATYLSKGYSVSNEPMGNVSEPNPAAGESSGAAEPGAESGPGPGGAETAATAAGKVSSHPPPPKPKPKPSPSAPKGPHSTKGKGTHVIYSRRMKYIKGPKADRSWSDPIGRAWLLLLLLLLVLLPIYFLFMGTGFSQKVSLLFNYTHEPKHMC